MTFNEVEFLTALQQREPKARRKRTLYETLDAAVPDWPALVRAPEFRTWALRVDSENGTRMMDRLKSLWDDPVFAAGDFATLLRLYKRSQVSALNDAGLFGWRRLLRREAAVRDEMLSPVLSSKYELLRLLGRGGNGEVFLVWSTETKKLYALKTVRRDLARSPSVRRSFRAEALTWIALGEHPNVAKAYFFEELDSSLYVTMDVVDGEDDGTGPSLADKLPRSPSLNQICVWFCQVADGLQHGYSHGLRAHRDIKPGNILVKRDGTAQVSDFGLAVAGEATLTTLPHEVSAAGTPLYMSPEQYRDAQSCDQRSDIYALGVTLYQVVSGGKLPFMPHITPRTPEEMPNFYKAVRQMHEQSTPAALSSPLWPIIEKCLSKRPQDRFQCIEAFRLSLSSVANRKDITIPLPPKATTDIWTLRDQGNTFMRLGKYEEAIRAFDLFSKSLGDGSVSFNRAVCMENLGRHAEAFAVYERFANANYDAKLTLAGLVNGSSCLRALKRIDEAVEYAQRAVSVAPEDADCWVCLGNAAFALKSWELAMRAYAKAQELDQMNPTPAYNFGLAAQRAGADEAAVRAFKAFLRLSQLDDERRVHVEKEVTRLATSLR